MNDFTQFLHAEWCTRVCSVLLHSIWISAAILAVTWCLDRLLFRRNARWSHRLYTVGLLSTLIALPLTGLLVRNQPTLATSAWNDPAAHVDSQSGPNWSLIPRSWNNDSAGITSQTDGKSSNKNAANAPISDADRVARTALPLSWQLNAREIAPWLVFAYGCGVILMALRWTAAMRVARRWSAGATMIESPELLAVIRQLRKQLGLRKCPRVMQSSHVTVPRIVGYFAPVVLLPASVLSGLTPSELELILMHEFVHIQRRDMWVNFLQRFAETVLFFNPCVWIISRRITLLREFCCDDATCTPSPSNENVAVTYANALLRVAALATNSEQPALAALSATGQSPSELRRRIARLFGEPINLNGYSRTSLFAVMSLLVALLLIPAASHAENEDIKKLGFPISTIAGVDGNQSLKDIAAATGGKYYKVRNRKMLARILQKESNRRVIIDSRLLDQPEIAVQPAREIDTESPITLVAYRMKDPDVVLQILKVMLDGQVDVRMNVNAKGDQLIVRASQTNHELIAKTIEAMEADPDEVNEPEGDGETKFAHAKTILAAMTHQPEVKGEATKHYVFNFDDKETFWEDLEQSIDAAVDSEDFVRDVLESYRTDRKGPQVDIKKLVDEHLDNSVSYVYATKGKHEAFSWSIKPGHDQQVRDVVDKMLKHDPNGKQLANGTWVISSPREEGEPDFESAAFAVTEKAIYCSTDLALLNELIKSPIK